MSVFAAMLLDSYRELNSRKLFWVILALSGIFVIMYGSIGFNESGMYLFYGIWQIESQWINAQTPFSALLYRSIFASIVVPYWLAFIATILALISTATVFPDFISGGSIDLVLSKPVGRIRLFAYKYLASMLFVLLQVALFCVGIFLCMGARLGDWEWRVFLAIPIVVVFFSYLFSVCVLIGVWTRSALAALLLTLVLWSGLFSINFAEGVLNAINTQFAVEAQRHDDRLTALEGSRQVLVERDDDLDAPEIGRLDAEIAEVQEDRDTAGNIVRSLDFWHGAVRGIQAIFPKTAETIGLLDRYLSRDSDVRLADLIAGNIERTPDGGFVTRRDREDQAMFEMEQEYTSRSLWYVIGTSLIFEFLVLSLACFIFCRRDY